MFKFNFAAESDSNDDGSDSPKGEKVEDKLRPCEIVSYQEKHKEYAEGAGETVTLSNGSVIHHVDLGVAEWRVKQEPDVAAATKLNSDIVPHVYEGGLKIWECAVDLAEYISSLQIAFRGLRVLELGCGVGIPGLYAYNQGAEVHFQDYNESVLNTVTIPSVVLNIVNHSQAEDDLHQLPRCKFYSGDWSQLVECLATGNQQSKFDIILTSETIYSSDNYQILHDTMKALLKPAGKIYLAAKSYYFGVGGNMRDFKALVLKNDTFAFNICKEISDGVSREVMELCFK